MNGFVTISGLVTALNADAARLLGRFLFQSFFERSFFADPLLGCFLNRVFRSLDQAPFDCRTLVVF